MIRINSKLRNGLGAIATSLTFACLGFYLLGYPIALLAGQEKPGVLVGFFVGFPTGGYLGFRLGHKLTSRFPKTMLSILGMVLGALVGVVPAYVLAWIGRPTRSTPEVFAISLTQMLAVLVFIVLVPLGGLLGMLYGHRLAASCPPDIDQKQDALR